MEFDSNGHLIPYFNAAAIPKIPENYPGVVSSDINCLIEYSFLKKNYKLTSRHNIFDSFGKNCIKFFFPQVCLVDTIKLLLYDKDDRCYDYTIKSGINHKKLTTLHKGQNQKSWQIIKFKPTLLRYIKIKGTRIYNAPKDVQDFVVVHFQMNTEKSNHAVSPYILR
jgi:hypothetical protein